MNKKVLTVIGNICLYFVALGLLGSSFAKFMGEPKVTEALNLINLTNPIIVAIIELSCAVLLAIPKSQKFGILISTAFIGGIIVAENALNGKPYPGIFLMIMLWIGCLLRHPEILGLSSKMFKNN